MFVKQPGEVYEILGEQLCIPCVTDTYIDYVLWQADLSGTTTIIGDSTYGINSANQNHYELEKSNTPRNNFTLRIKSVRLDEPQLRCDVEVPSIPPT